MRRTTRPPARDQRNDTTATFPYCRKTPSYAIKTAYCVLYTRLTSLSRYDTNFLLPPPPLGCSLDSEDFLSSYWSTGKLGFSINLRVILRRLGNMVYRIYRRVYPFPLFPMFYCSALSFVLHALHTYHPQYSWLRHAPMYDSSAAATTQQYCCK